MIMDKEKILMALKEASGKLDEVISIIEGTVDTTPVTPAAAETAAVEEVKEEQKVTIDDLRKKLATMAGNGHKAAVKKLLEKYGSTKISGVDPKDYENLMRDALEVENAK